MSDELDSPGWCESHRTCVGFTVAGAISTAVIVGGAIGIYYASSSSNCPEGTTPGAKGGCE